MKLTEEQQKVVEENHSLIYWVISLKGLPLDDWYDILAIELCKSVVAYKPERGGLANYYKTRCDYVVNKEYRKNRAQKRTHNGLYDLEETFSDDSQLVQLSYDYNEDIMESILLKELIDGEHGEIVRLKYMGYTQDEISEMLNISQSQISKILKKVREEIDQ